MQRIDTPNSRNGKFVNGNANQGIKGTEVSAEWLNSVQEEICSVVESTGARLDSSKDNQLFTAIKQIIAGMHEHHSENHRVQSNVTEYTALGDDVILNAGDIVDISFMCENYTEVNNILTIKPFGSSEFVFDMHCLGTQNYRCTFVASEAYSGKMFQYKFSNNTNQTQANLRVRGFIIKK